MVFINLKLSFKAENISKVYLQNPETYNWRMVIKCTNCHHQHNNIVEFNKQDSIVQQNKSDKSVTNFIMTCKECKHSMSIDIQPKSDFIIDLEKDKKNWVLAVFECRNVDLVEWKYENGISAQGAESSTRFHDIDLTDLWCEYDEQTSQTVQIEDFSYTFERNQNIK